MQMPSQWEPRNNMPKMHNMDEPHCADGFTEAIAEEASLAEQQAYEQRRQQAVAAQLAAQNLCELLERAIQGVMHNDYSYISALVTALNLRPAVTSQGHIAPARNGVICALRAMLGITPNPAIVHSMHSLFAAIQELADECYALRARA